MEEALAAGYRHVDTAYNYRNEGEVGTAIHNWAKKTGGDRKDVFIVTKVRLGNRCMAV